MTDAPLEESANPPQIDYRLLLREDVESAPVMATSGMLTAAILYAAIERVRADPGIRRCLGSDTHVVHPHATGWTTCAQCFGPVWAGPGEPPS